MIDDGYSSSPLAAAVGPPPTSSGADGVVAGGETQMPPAGSTASHAAKRGWTVDNDHELWVLNEEGVTAPQMRRALAAPFGR
jgi:hypothetical protein